MMPSSSYLLQELFYYFNQSIEEKMKAETNQISFPKQANRISFETGQNCLKIMVLVPESQSQPALRFFVQIEDGQYEINGKSIELSSKELQIFLKDNPNCIFFNPEEVAICIDYKEEKWSFQMEEDYESFWSLDKPSSSCFCVDQDTITCYPKKPWWSKQTSRLPLPKKTEVVIKFFNFIHLSSMGIGVGIISAEGISKNVPNSKNDYESICYWFEPASWERMDRPWNSSITNQGASKQGWFAIGVDEITLTVSVDLSLRQIKWQNGLETYTTQIDEAFAQKEIYFYVQMGNSQDSVCYELIS